MFRSILDDIKQAFAYGNMVNKLIIINVAVFVVFALVKAFTFNSGFYSEVLSYVAVPGSLISLLYKPWTLFTHMFMHGGFWHLLWNMVGLMIFGRIVGDLLGDRRILPLYILGGICGAIFFILSFQVFLGNVGGFAIGASAAVLALAVIGGVVAPDYGISLILIGNVKLKYIVFAFILMDVIGTQGNSNVGGHYGHLGGIFFGFIFIYFLRKGIDLTNFSWLKLWKNSDSKPIQRERPKARVIKLKANVSSHDNFEGDREDFEEKLNSILEKIKVQGYNKLTTEEKEFLNDASKQK